MLCTAVMLQRACALAGRNQMAAPPRGNGIGGNCDTATTTFASVRVKDEYCRMDDGDDHQITPNYTWTVAVS